MSDERLSDIERLEELLADRATVGLSSDEQRELEALLARVESADPDASERAAAALDLALGPVEYEPLSAESRRKLQARAEAFVAQRAALAKRADMRVLPGEKPRGAPSWIGWFVAAAAVVLAVIGWWPQIRRTQPLDASQARADLLARAGTLRVDWKGLMDISKSASGDVVWSNDAQQGFLRISGLAPNDPRREQYQLWIFDESQEHPIDGGVFDLASASSEALIAIDAKLRVGKPKAFAVTVEKPGGVVVSDQKRIALLAAM